MHNVCLGVVKRFLTFICFVVPKCQSSLGFKGLENETPRPFLAFRSAPLKIYHTSRPANSEHGYFVGPVVFADNLNKKKVLKAFMKCSFAIRTLLGTDECLEHCDQLVNEFRTFFSSMDSIQQTFKFTETVIHLKMLAERYLAIMDVLLSRNTEKKDFKCSAKWTSSTKLTEDFNALGIPTYPRTILHGVSYDSERYTEAQSSSYVAFYYLNGVSFGHIICFSLIRIRGCSRAKHSK